MLALATLGATTLGVSVLGASVLGNMIYVQHGADRLPMLAVGEPRCE